MSFDIDVGHASDCGPRETNEDFAAVQRPAQADRDMGWIAALADGVSTGGAGGVAAQTTVMSLVSDFFSAPSTWDTTVALDRILRAQNTWLVAHNRRRAWLQDGGTALTTLTALVLRGHSWTLAHVGDSRAWLLRDGELSQLSQDHALGSSSIQNTLTRALGLDDHVQVDFSQGELQPGDIVVLTSDGVHGVLKRKRIAALLAAADNAQAASEALVSQALGAGTRDNATALVLVVRGLDAGRYDDVLRAARALPLPPKMSVGSVLDHYTIDEPLANNGVHHVYRAHDPSTVARVAIKTLHESRGHDAEERAMLAHEAWLGAKLAERLSETDSGGFVRVHEPREPTAFYIVFDWHGGRTLAQWLAAGERASIAQIVDAGIAVTRALGRMHRAGVIHRDIKPDNLHLGDDGRWRVLDLGVALSGREPKVLRTLHAGTPSYMNPEQWDAEPKPADAASDVYALGVTLYQWLTGRLPYGQVEPYQRARFRHDARAPSRWAPDVPIWLDHVVGKAIALDPNQRFETAEELRLALERGAARPLDAPPSTPLSRRDPLTLWLVLLALSVVLNGLLMFWLVFLPR